MRFEIYLISCIVSLILLFVPVIAKYLVTALIAHQTILKVLIMGVLVLVFNLPWLFTK
jgi:hypothetical protein